MGRQHGAASRVSAYDMQHMRASREFASLYLHAEVHTLFVSASALRFPPHRCMTTAGGWPASASCAVDEPSLRVLGVCLACARRVQFQEPRWNICNFDNPRARWIHVSAPPPLHPPRSALSGNRMLHRILSPLIPMLSRFTQKSRVPEEEGLETDWGGDADRITMASTTTACGRRTTLPGNRLSQSHWRWDCPLEQLANANVPTCTLLHTRPYLVTA